MATLSVIQEQDTGALTDLEKELVRQLLSITGKAGTATYIDSNTRMVNTTPAQRQIIRALLLDYDDISFDTTKARGGSEGTDYDPERDKAAIVKELRRMLYPSLSNDSPDLVDATNSFVPEGTIRMVPVIYKVGSDELS
jgi:hypothetical protein